MRGSIESETREYNWFGWNLSKSIELFEIQEIFANAFPAFQMKLISIKIDVMSFQMDAALWLIELSEDFFCYLFFVF